MYSADLRAASSAKPSDRVVIIRRRRRRQIILVISIIIIIIVYKNINFSETHAARCSRATRIATLRRTSWLRGRISLNVRHFFSSLFTPSRRSCHWSFDSHKRMLGDTPSGQRSLSPTPGPTYEADGDSHGCGDEP